MAWTNEQLKIFAAGMAIGGQWNHVGDGTIPIPNIDPLPGNYFGQIVQVRLWSDFPGAIVRASFDGTLPSATSEPIGPDTITEIDVTTTIYAFAQVRNKTSKIAAYKFVLDNPFDTTDIVYKDKAVPSIPEETPVIGIHSITITVEEDTVYLDNVAPGITDDHIIELVTKE